MDVIEDRNNKIWVIGYGSLIHPESLNKTIPSRGKVDMRPVRVVGFKRLFNLASVRSWHIHSGQAQSIAVLNVERVEGGEFGGVIFSVEPSYLHSLDKREYIYRRVTGVKCVDFFTGQPLPKGILYRAMTGEELRSEKPAFFKQRVQPLGLDTLIQKELLPDDKYLSLCLQGAYGWGKKFGDDFLKNTFLSDRTTPLSQHLSSEETSKRLNEDLIKYIKNR